MEQYKEYEVICPIYGLVIDTLEPCTIGKFTFYRFPRDQETILKKYYFNSEVNCKTFFSAFHDEPYLISTKIYAESDKDAREKAELLFARLENLFSILLFRPPYIFGVSILNKKSIHTNKYMVIGEDRTGKRGFSISGPRASIELSKFINDDGRFFADIIKNFTNSNQTLMEKKLLLAIDFGGMAVQNYGQPSSFIHAITALECLLVTSEKGIKTRVSNNFAYFFGHDKSDCINLRNTIRQFYKIRSDLAHGHSSSIDLNDNKQAITCAQEAIFSFIADEGLSRLKTKKDFETYISALEKEKGDVFSNV